MERADGAAMRRGRGRPRKDDGPDSAMILNAAIVAFARYGWEGTNLRQLAEASGVDAALIARRFDGKMGLWRAIIDHVSDTLRAAFEAAQQQEARDPAERLRITIDHFIRMNMELPDLGRFFIDQIARPGQRRDYAVEKMWQVYRDLMLPVVEEARASGALPADTDAATYVALLLGAVSMPLLMRTIALEGLDNAPARDAFIDMVVTLFAARGGDNSPVQGAPS